MIDLVLPPLEDIDVEDLTSLPRGYRYELHDGALLVRPPATFWRNAVAGRLLLLVYAARADVFFGPRVRGSRPRDCREPDLGVVIDLPPDTLSCSHLPASAYSLVVEITRESADRAAWCASQEIPGLWTVEVTPERNEDDALVSIHRLVAGGYVLEQTVLLSVLESLERAALLSVIECAGPGPWACDADPGRDAPCAARPTPVGRTVVGPRTRDPCC